MRLSRATFYTALTLSALGLGACTPRNASPRDGEATTSNDPATGHVQAAQDAVRQGDVDRALAEFTAAIEINPNLTSAHFGMADIYRMKGDYARAEQRYAKVATLEPKNFDAQYFHGLMLHLLDRLPEAIQAYLRALAVNPGDFKSNLNIATAYYQLDENIQALPYARRAVELSPQDGPARFNLGAIYGALNRHSEAVREYQQAAELMPLTPPLLLNLADSLGKLERYDEMANALMQVVKVEPTAVAHERLGFARFRLGQYDPAKQSFTSALKLDADYFPALNGLGVCNLNDWIRSGRKDMKLKDSGIASLRRSLQLNRDQPQIVEIITRYSR